MYLVMCVKILVFFLFINSKMSATKVYTIDVNTNESIVEMINGVPQTEMRLINYRFKMNYTGIAEPNRPDVLYLDIGTVVGSTYFIDNNLNTYRFPIMLDNGYIDPDNNYSITFASGVNIPLTMSGPLDHSIVVRIYNKNGNLISNDILKHCFLQFEFN